MRNKTQSQGKREKVRSQPRNQPDARKEKEKIGNSKRISYRNKKKSKKNRTREQGKSARHI